MDLAPKGAQVSRSNPVDEGLFHRYEHLTVKYSVAAAPGGHGSGTGIDKFLSV